MVLSAWEAEQWRREQAEKEWLEWYKTLDHTMCRQFFMEPGEPWEKCRGMHCGDCGKSTGAQGHMTKIDGEWVCPTDDGERNPFIPRFGNRWS